MKEQTEINRLQDWFKNRITRFKRMIMLIQSGQKPAIEAFYIDDLFTVEHGKVSLYWKISNSHYLAIDRGVGNVTGRDKITLKLSPQVKSFTIIAYGGFKKVSKTIHFEPLSFHDYKMPMASIREPQMQIKLPKLRASHSESNKKGRKFQHINEQVIPQLNVQLPNKPKAVELQKLRFELKEAFQVKEVEVLKAHLAKLKQTDLLEKLAPIDYDNISELKS